MSALQKQAASPGSDSDPRYANVDERKRKRMISNRESAKRSRMKRQRQLEDLVNEVGKLQNETSQLRQKISVASQRYMEMESANNVLRAQAMELTERLGSLNQVVQMLEEFNSFAMDIPEIPDSFFEPWQQSCLAQPIMASADVFPY